MKVRLFNTTGRRVPKTRISRLVTEVLNRFRPGKDAEIRIIFVSDDEIASLNRQFLGKDQPTDVIAFDLSDGDDSLEGEVYVSVTTAERQAREYNVTLWEELARLATHGTLHLVGFDDATNNHRQEMQRLEDEFLSLVPRGEKRRADQQSKEG